MFERKKFNKQYEGAVVPFKIIGNHVWNNDTCNKGAQLAKGEGTPFIDGELWHTFPDFCEQRAKEVNGL